MKLKALLDAARAADEKVNGILAEMSLAFEDGTPEGVERAMGMREGLEAAKAEATQANEAYVTAREISLPDERMNSNARKFVPVSQEAAKAAGQGTIITRAEWERLPYDERYAFLKGGGTLMDNLPE